MEYETSSSKNINNNVISQNPQIKQLEKIAEEKSKEIFQNFCELKDNENQKSLNLDFIRKTLTLNKNKLDLNNTSTKIITTHHRADAIKKGKLDSDSYYDEELTQTDFSNLVTGNNIKNLLYAEESLVNKRLHIEQYSELYELMGGDKKGISKEAITKCLILSKKFYTNPEVFLKEDLNNIQIDRISEEKIRQEVEEIFKLLKTDEDQFLSIREFINIMTSGVDLPKEAIKIFTK